MGVRVEILHVMWKLKLTMVISCVRREEGGGIFGILYDRTRLDDIGQEAILKHCGKPFWVLF